MFRPNDGNPERNRCSTVTGLFALLLLWVSLTTSLHQHRDYARLLSSHAVSGSISGLFSFDSEAEHQSISGLNLPVDRYIVPDCALCDFTATSVVQAADCQVQVLPCLSQAPAALHNTPHPVYAFRFADRSSARAPPLGTWVNFPLSALTRIPREHSTRSQ
jgi:hypothetical protein